MKSHTHTHGVLPEDYVTSFTLYHNNKVQSDLDALHTLPNITQTDDIDDVILIELDEQIGANKPEAWVRHICRRGGK